MRLVIACLLALVAVVLWRAGAGATRPRLPAIALGVLAVLFALSSALVIIPAGHVGVVDLFGQVSPVTLKSGIRLVNPLARVTRCRSRRRSQGDDGRAVEGGIDGADRDECALPSRPGQRRRDLQHGRRQLPRGAPRAPVPLGQPRRHGGLRGARALHVAAGTARRARRRRAPPARRSRGIVIEATPLRRLALRRGSPPPSSRSCAPSRRASAWSSCSQRSARKRTASASRPRASRTSSASSRKGISEPLLRWKGIEATKKLAESSNAKVVVIGAGKDGLPLILGGDK